MKALIGLVALVPIAILLLIWMLRRLGLFVYRNAVSPKEGQYYRMVRDEARSLCNTFLDYNTPVVAGETLLAGYAVGVDEICRRHRNGLSTNDVVSAVMEGIWDSRIANEGKAESANIVRDMVLRATEGHREFYKESYFKWRAALRQAHGLSDDVTLDEPSVVPAPTPPAAESQPARVRPAKKAKERGPVLIPVLVTLVVMPATLITVAVVAGKPETAPYRPPEISRSPEVFTASQVYAAAIKTVDFADAQSRMDSVLKKLLRATGDQRSLIASQDAWGESRDASVASQDSFENAQRKLLEMTKARYAELEKQHANSVCKPHGEDVCISASAHAGTIRQQLPLNLGRGLTVRAATSDDNTLIISIRTSYTNEQIEAVARSRGLTRTEFTASLEDALDRVAHDACANPVFASFISQGGIIESEYELVDGQSLHSSRVEGCSPPPEAPVAPQDEPSKPDSEGPLF